MFAMNAPSMLEKVRARLEPLRGESLDKVAVLTGISYDTLLRIRESKVDPAFSKVQKLAEHFRVVR